eukprot:11924404-Alexandrium_andersonii.AAC.1
MRYHRARDLPEMIGLELRVKGDLAALALAPALPSLIGALGTGPTGRGPSGLRMTGGAIGCGPAPAAVAGTMCPDTAPGD